MMATECKRKIISDRLGLGVMQCHNLISTLVQCCHINERVAKRHVKGLIIWTHALIFTLPSDMSSIPSIVIIILIVRHFVQVPTPNLISFHSVFLLTIRPPDAANKTVRGTRLFPIALHHCDQ